MVYFTVVKVRFLKNEDFKLLGRVETNPDYGKKVLKSLCLYSSYKAFVLDFTN